MHKIISVIKREYIQIVRTKGFIIGTILGPVFMLALIVVPPVPTVNEPPTTCTETVSAEPKSTEYSLPAEA
jgi:ABC-type Na+ efflux pump permease subunit